MAEEFDALFRGEFTYPGGFSKLVQDTPEHRQPYDGMAEFLDGLNAIGLAQLQDRHLPADPPEPPKSPVTAAEKYAQLSAEFAGRPALLAVHGLVIAAARRATPPAIAEDMFQTLWQHHALFLLAELDIRWKLSALQTFRDFGTSEAQRRTAAELTVFFNMMKLYESERLFSGHRAPDPFGLDHRAAGRLPLRLSAYSLKGGDLDRNMLGHLWLSAEEDPVLRPLACHLLTAVNRDKGTVFRRFRLMRRALKRRTKGQ
ncbi:hypothetical protein [Shimia sp. SDUM112013]|uniref:hypothetical protein n=1 Tax=Shimia sp. SDUM112013 TaxID=3136160 RepID=UPI0032EB6D66